MQISLKWNAVLYISEKNYKTATAVSNIVEAALWVEPNSSKVAKDPVY